MKFIFLSAVILAAFGFQATAATINFAAPTAANGAFNVVVQATNLFAGRNSSTDGIVSYGFNVKVGNPLLLTFNGASSGPLFDPTTSEPGTNVFAAASGLGIFAPVSAPLTLVTLRFTRIGAGNAQVLISSDLSNLFQGLQFVNAPFAESIAATITVADVSVPEPASGWIAAMGLAALGILRRPGANARA